MSQEAPSQQRSDVPAEYIHHCRKLLLRHEKAWIKFQREQGRMTPQQESKSQTIDWQGTPYDCSRNTCQGNCLWDATKAHQKCKCQQLYAPGRNHLIAPCKNCSQGPHLSFDQCRKLGYLNDKYASESIQKPNYPAITCDHCREAFEALQHNFSPYNYQQVVACIDRLTNPVEETEEEQKKLLLLAQKKNPNGGFMAFCIVLLLILTAFIAYKLFTGCFHAKDEFH